MKKHFLSICLVLFTAACAPAPLPSGTVPTALSTQIYRGNKVPKDSDLLKSVVRIISIGNAGHLGWCSGTLIAPDLVLTAAHCLGGDVDHVRVEVYKDSQTSAASIPASSWVANSGYRATNGKVKIPRGADPKSWLQELLIRRLQELRAGQENPFFNSFNFVESDSADVGLIKLSRRVPAAFHALKLSTDPADLSLLMDIELLGYGYSQSPASASFADSGRLLHAHSTVLGWSNDRALVSMISDTGQGICSGDSGGAMVAKVRGENRLVAVVSRGDCSNFSIGIAVPSALRWIQENGAKLQ